MLKKVLVGGIVLVILLIIITLWIIFPFDSVSDVEVCSCTEDLDCGDFNTQEDAQVCFEYCGPEDVHRLDGNKDGVVCESLV